MSIGRNIVEIKKFSKQYQNGLAVFEDISLEISHGEVVSFVGPSGSGKTTLLRCLIGLDNEYSGIIKIEGKERNEYLDENRIAFVFQKYSNFKWLNVYDNIAAAFHNKTISETEQKERTTAILEEVGLIGFENYYINQLSGGMQQRIAVARALVQDTDIIAMDEPFGALDMKIRESLQNLIKEINKKHKKTILFVTHDIEEALLISDKIVMLTKLPVKTIKVFNNDKLYFKNNEDASVKYQKDFTDLRKQIEDNLSGDEDVNNFILRKLDE